MERGIFLSDLPFLQAFGEPSPEEDVPESNDISQWTGAEPPPTRLGVARKRMESLLAVIRESAPEGTIMSSGVLFDMADAIHRNLPQAERARVSEAVLEATLDEMALGGRATAKSTRRMAVRMAGNWDELRAGRFIKNPEVGDPPCWASLEVVEVEDRNKERIARNRPPLPPGRVLTMLSLTGPTAGGVLRQSLSDKYIAYVMSKIGFPAYKRKDPADIFNAGLMARVGRVDGRMAMLEFAALNCHRERNSLLWRSRHGDCVKGRQVECSACGETLRTCPWAVKR